MISFLSILMNNFNIFLPFLYVLQPFTMDFIASEFHLATRSLLPTVFGGDTEKPVNVSIALKVQAPPLQLLTVWSLPSSPASSCAFPFVLSIPCSFCFL